MGGAEELMSEDWTEVLRPLIELEPSSLWWNIVYTADEW